MNTTTDYAIRALLYIATSQPASGPDIAEQMKIPQSYVTTVLIKLKNAGFIRSDRSRRYGGYYLNKPADQIVLLDVLNVMEGTMKVNRCLEEDAYCNRCATETCPVRKFYQTLQDCIEEKTGGITLQHLVDEL